MMIRRKNGSCYTPLLMGALFAVSLFLSACVPLENLTNGNSTGVPPSGKPRINTADAPPPNAPKGAAATTTAPKKEKHLIATSPPERYRITDLPVPDNYKFDEKESFIFETTAIKTGILVYHGSVDPLAVIDFYKTEMPKYGWTLVHLFEHHDVNMLFQKEDWTCQLRLDASSGWSAHTLTLTIAPRDKNAESYSAPPPNKP